MDVRELLVKRDELARLDGKAEKVLAEPHTIIQLYDYSGRLNICLDVAKHPSLHAEVVDVFRRLAGIQECELADLDCKVRAINTLLEG